MVTNLAKNTASVLNLNKKGVGWRYNESDITYEMPELYYNSFGQVPAVTNTTKHTASITNLAKS